MQSRMKGVCMSQEGEVKMFRLSVSGALEK